jgi:hypothetical protein
VNTCSGPVVSNKRFYDRLLGCPYSWIFQPRQHRRIALASENSIKNRQARQPGYVADDMVDLQVHLIECFLHAKNLFGSSVDQAPAVPQ